MKWIPSPPPNGVYERAVEMFGVSLEMGAIFCYGDNIHALHEPSPDIVVHEKVHQRQQATMSPQLWWDLFFKSPEFRYEQEIEAYREQYKFINKVVKDRNKKAEHLDFYAKSLSGPNYGKMVTYSEAIREIRNEKTQKKN